MTKIDVLLINAMTSKKVPNYIPNGLIWVAAVLRQNGFNVRVYNRNTDKKGIEEILKLFNPTIVGISVLTGSVILDAIEISKTIKQFLSDATIVWGGLHPTLFPKYVLSESYVDYIVMGEGEYPMAELTDYILGNKCKYKLEDIKNIGYKQNGVIHLNALRDFIDMNSLPMPAFDLLDMDKYFLYRPYARRTICLMSSRGCPYYCSFCYNKKVNKGTWRGISALKLVELVEFIKSKYKVNGFLFHDDNFDANGIRLREFCNLLIERNTGIHWEHCSRVNYAKEERIALEKKSGCALISYGLESGSDRILKMINKGQTVAQIENAIKICKKYGISTSVGSIIGYPFETEKDLEETTKLFERLKPTQVFTTIYNPYPGSDLYDYVIREGLFSEPSTLEGQGKIYAVDNLQLNMSPIPNETLRNIINKYITRNLINNVIDYLRFMNIQILFASSIEFLFRRVTGSKILPRVGGMFKSFLRGFLSRKEPFLGKIGRGED